jgi:dimethylargininase
VLRVGRRLFVGRSSRTNAAGIERLTSVAEPHGYRVMPVAVTGSLTSRARSRRSTTSGCS